ncbi:Glycosyl hydrolases family 2, sugar binding domain [Streptomyces sp. 1222.5]|uniref:discoidin domain-containing protein n=1 Tax=unclassified Streptomyces TaxID=2593676 RepID=UPI0008948D56|nr:MULTISPECIES: discoidin domain-containing protein [unclassified Streptomyces]PKW12250.1 glycosyl hydrolase family 2 [Streptomyces sp. 5112.2]SEB59730.1 Glycosyl hydrolases family 2, sugar binding domain [Streptomyces sp. 1222.5]
MTDQSSPSRHLSRRTVVTSGSTLLAGFGLGSVLPVPHAAAVPTGAPVERSTSGELALYRPVSVSSTAYAATLGSFVVDRLSVQGVRGSGWRAEGGDPQWIAVDLQAVCEVTHVRLTFEAAASTPVYTPPTSGNVHSGTTGKEVQSSYSTAFVVETSTDGESWTAAYRTTAGTGGVVNIQLPRPVRARRVRMTSQKRSSPLPLGLNGFEVYGTAEDHRPSATGWTDWGSHPGKAPGLTVADDGSVPVESGWRLTMDDWADADGAALSRTSVDTGGWLPATVPGTVLGSLVDQGKLPDPVAGLNNLRIPEALSRHSWWYKRDFTLPRGLRTGAGRHVWLEFDGVNHKAEVWLNGKQVGDLTYPFARAAFDITRQLDGAGENGLAVRITPMPVPGSPGDKGPEGDAWVDAGAQQMNLNSPTYLASSGWDWMPAVRDRAAGIWNHVRLRSTGHVVIGDPRVDTVLPDLPDVSVAEVTVVVPVRNADSVDHRATVTAAFGSARVSKSVTVKAGESADVVFAPDAFAQLKLRDPELWWPNGLGEARLHDLTLTAAVGGQESDRRTTRFGIRQFGYEYEVPLPFTASRDAYTQTVTFERQQARHLRVKCLTRATSWGSSLWTLSVGDSARPGVDLALHAAAEASTTDQDGNGAANATDGDAGTRWSSAYEDDQWIRVDLGSVQSFDRVDLTWEQAYAKTFVVQVSANGSDWTDVKSVDNGAVPLPFSNGNASLQVEDFDRRTARYVRLDCGLRNTSWGNSLWTFSVVDRAVPGTDLSLRQKATASTEESDNPASNATDGNPNTRWSSAYEDHQWIQVDLGSRRGFDRVAVVWETAYPKTYVIQVSDDGENWTDVKSVSNTPDPLKISVNGVRVLARGGNWGWDELLRRMPAERMDAAVRMHRDMNFTMIRNWVGSSDREEFFAACDRHGILVWNDFPNAWGMDPPDHEAFVALARDTVLRFRSHPCVVLWCGANEGNPPAAIDKGMRAAVAEQAPGLLYQNNSAGGIVTGGGPYGWVEPEKYFDPMTYGSKDFGFHTEIGMPVVSTAASVRTMTGDEPEWPIKGAWYLHDWSDRGNQAPHVYKAAIEARLGEAGDLDDFARKAQFVNYENTRAMFEAWNANLWDNASGLMLWMSHPAWHSTVWQTYDYDFDVNGTYYGARSACEPLHVQADPVKWQVIAVNHTSTDLRGATVSARVFDLGGRQLGPARTAHVNVSRAGTEKAFTAEWSKDLPDLHLLRLTLTDARGEEVSRNTYWRYRDASSLRDLNKAEQVRLTGAITKVSRSGDRHGLTATVANRGSAVAAMVRLSLLEDAHGSRVLPTLYSDNYLWLLPGESRTVRLSWPSDACSSRRPVLTAEAYNSAPTTLRG